MIGSGRSYVVVGSCFFSGPGYCTYTVWDIQGLTGLDRVWIWATAGQEKNKLTGTKIPLQN